MDKLTGLGVSLSEYLANGARTIAECYSDMEKQYAGAQTVTVPFSAMLVEDGCLFADGERIADMDDAAYAKLCSLLEIPTAYLKKLPPFMRESNVNYWFRFLGDSEVTAIHAGDELVEISADATLRLLDVFKVLSDVAGEATLIQSVQQTNAVMFDMAFLNDDPYEVEGEPWYGGIRYIHNDGLKAPEVSPILISGESCGVIEFGEEFDKLNLKNMAMTDILSMVKQRVTDCANMIDKQAERFKHICKDEIKAAKRRISLLCKENNVPDRIKGRVLECYDESCGWMESLTVSQCAEIFANAMYLDTVKQTSARKLQEIAGHIISKASDEHRCDKCDNRIEE